jgi:hypothetical protein
VCAEALQQNRPVDTAMLAEQRWMSRENLLTLSSEDDPTLHVVLFEYQAEGENPFSLKKGKKCS